MTILSILEPEAPSYPLLYQRDAYAAMLLSSLYQGNRERIKRYIKESAKEGSEKSGCRSSPCRSTASPSPPKSGSHIQEAPSEGCALLYPEPNAWSSRQIYSSSKLPINTLPLLVFFPSFSMLSLFLTLPIALLSCLSRSTSEL